MPHPETLDAKQAQVEPCTLTAIDRKGPTRDLKRTALQPPKEIAEKEYNCGAVLLSRNGYKQLLSERDDETTS